MATAADDLKIGQYLMVTQQEAEQPLSMWGMPTSSRPRTWSLPCRVLAVSLPYIAVEFRGERHSIDVRECELQKVTRQFAEALDSKRPVPAKAKKRRRKEKPDPRSCPRCGTRLVQLLSYEYGAARWIPTCKQCGWQEQPAKV